MLAPGRWQPFHRGTWRSYSEAKAKRGIARSSPVDTVNVSRVPNEGANSSHVDIRRVRILSSPATERDLRVACSFEIGSRPLACRSGCDPLLRCGKPFHHIAGPHSPHVSLQGRRLDQRPLAQEIAGEAAGSYHPARSANRLPTSVQTKRTAKSISRACLARTRRTRDILESDLARPSSPDVNRHEHVSDYEGDD
jgi:hypothetical protein